MGEKGESSGTKPLDEIWAKLVPSDSRYSCVDIRSEEIVICSEILSTSSDKHNWCKIVRNSDLCSATIENKRPNAILVDGVEVGKEGTVVIKDGSEITSGPEVEGFVNYQFNIVSSPETCQRQLQISVDVEHAKCSICLNIWHDVVSVAPCLHNFCNGCFSEWLRRSQEKNSTVLCPQCRCGVQYVGKNHFLHTIAEDMVRADSSLRRSDEDVAILDSYSSVRSHLVIGSGKNRRKRAATSSPLDVQSDRTDRQCPQCVTRLHGFRCGSGTVHVHCQDCNGLMPLRFDVKVPQFCELCDAPYCGAYWSSLQVTVNASYPVCSPGALKPISEYTISRIPLIAHEKNMIEQNITENCIRQMGTTLQDIISGWISRLDRREIDTRRLTQNPLKKITSRSFVCSDCYDKLVSFLLYWFRVASASSNSLPPDARGREDCWYGYACRTQHHSEEHARKRNHVCRPTRGSDLQP